MAFYGTTIGSYNSPILTLSSFKDGQLKPILLYNCPSYIQYRVFIFHVTNYIVKKNSILCYQIRFCQVVSLIKDNNLNLKYLTLFNLRVNNTFGWWILLVVWYLREIIESPHNKMQPLNIFTN